MRGTEEENRKREEDVPVSISRKLSEAVGIRKKLIMN